MDLGIAGRTAIVCASSKGLGRACAVELARAGCRVAINGRDPARLAQIRDELLRHLGPHLLGDLELFGRGLAGAFPGERRFRRDVVGVRGEIIDKDAIGSGERRPRVSLSVGDLGRGAAGHKNKNKHARNSTMEQLHHYLRKRSRKARHDEGENLMPASLCGRAESSLSLWIYPSATVRVRLDADRWRCRRPFTQQDC
jgi:hypothetical protein